MGTGGFLTMSIKYLNEKYKNKIDWVKNKDNIIGFDIDENVRNMALLNTFIETGQLCDETICKQDTLHNDMQFDDGTIMEKAKIILANEPMGLKNITFASCCKRIRKNLKSGTKAEPLFLKLFMEALDDGGRCAVIVPDGTLSTKSILHTDVRKMLIENFNLKKIISLNGNFFLNTNVQTSILFFTKDNTKTKSVEFCELTLKDTTVSENVLVTANYADIKKNNYSLFANKYRVSNKVDVGGIEYKRLGDICDFDDIAKHPTSYGKPAGKYRFLTGAPSTELYCDKPDTDKLYIIQNKTNGGGKCTLSLESNFACASHTIIYRAKGDDDAITTKYIYHYLSTNINILESGYRGSNQKNITKEFIQNVEIPIPTLAIQAKIMTIVDAFHYSIVACVRQNYELYNLIDRYLEYMTFDAALVKLTDICTLNKQHLNGHNIGEYEFINYVDIGCIVNNKVARYERLDSDYPSRAKRIFKRGDILLSTVRPNLKNFAYVTDGIVNGVCSSGFCVISGNKGINSKYVYYQIGSQNVTDYLSENATGSQYPTVNTSVIENIAIKYPAATIQAEIVEYSDNLQSMIDSNCALIDKNKVCMQAIINKYVAHYAKECVSDNDSNSASDSDSDSDSNSDRMTMMM